MANLTARNRARPELRDGGPEVAALVDVFTRTLPGADVADAILATWIGPKPGRGDDFKKALLGG